MTKGSEEMGSGKCFETFRTGLTPFLGLPHKLEPGPVSGVVLGAPFDGGVLSRPGARMGPWALRSASLGVGRVPMPLRLQVPLLHYQGVVAQGWVDGGNLAILPFGQEQALEAVEADVGAWIAQGARSFLLGGDHLMSLGAIRAQSSMHGPLGLLVLDAHPDAAQAEAWGTPHHHGSWLRTAIEEKGIDPLRTVLAGLRAPSFDPSELRFLEHAGVRMWTPWDLRDPRKVSQLRGDITRVGQGPAYVSVDLDVLDPAFCPAVADPVPGGLTPCEALWVLDFLQEWSEPWVGADLMELAPVLGGGEESARAGLHIALRILAAEAKVAQKPLKLMAVMDEEEAS